MDIQLYLVNAGEDEFSTLAVLRQHLDISFADARDIVMDIPAALPPVAAASVDALQAALAAVGAEISTSMPQPVQEPEEAPQFNVDDLLDIFPETTEPVEDYSDEDSAQYDDDTDEDLEDAEDEDYEEEDDEEDDEEEDDENSEDISFNLVSCGNQKLRIVKLIQEALGCGLKEAKETCDAVPVTITFDSSYEVEVIELVNAINEAGGEAVWFFGDPDDDQEDSEDSENSEDSESSEESYDEESNIVLVLAKAGPSKLQVVKIIKEFLGIGLAEAKEYVDSAPVTIPLTVSQAADVKSLINRLDQVGAMAYGSLM